jgi:hypothetical protein
VLFRSSNTLEVTGATDLNGDVDIDNTDTDIDSSNNISLDAGAASNFTTAAGALTLAGAGGLILQGNAAEVDVTTTGAVDINGGAITVDATAGISLAAATASNITTTAGALTLQGAGGVDIAATSVITNVKGSLNVDEAVTLDTTLGVTGATNTAGITDSATILANNLTVTGTAVANTVAEGDNSTSIATTAFVHRAVTFSTIRTVSSNQTVLASDYTILCDASAGTFSLTLPDPAGVSGKIYVIRKINEVTSSNYYINITGYSIKQSTGTVIDKININRTLRIQSNGTDWYLID